MPKTSTPPPVADVAEVNINVALPAELHRALKVYAAQNLLTVKDTVIAAIEAWVA